MQFRSRHPEVFSEKGVSQYSYENICPAVQERCRTPGSLLKKETPAQVFSYEFCEVFKKTFFIEHLRTAISVNCLFS